MAHVKQMEHACVMDHAQALVAPSTHVKMPAIIEDNVVVMVNASARLDGQESLAKFQCAHPICQTNHVLIMVSVKKSRWMIPLCTGTVPAMLVGQALDAQMLHAPKVM